MYLIKNKKSNTKAQCALWLLLFLFFACRQNEQPELQSDDFTIQEIPINIDTLIDHYLKEHKKLAEADKLIEAENILKNAHDSSLNHAGKFHPKTGYIEHTLGNLYNNYFQDRKKAIPHFKQAVEIRKKLLPFTPEMDIELGKSYFALARVLRLTGEYQPALEQIQQCLSIREKGVPLDSMRVGRTYLEAGMIYREAGDLENSLRHLEQAVAFAIRPQHRASAWNEMATTYDLLLQPNKAVEFYKKAFEQYEKLEHYWPMGGCLVNLGAAYLKNEDYKNAEITLLEAQELNRLLLEADPNDVDVKLDKGSIVSNLGILYKRQGKLNKALDAAKESLAIAINNCGTPYHPEVASSYDNLGNVFAENKSAEEALAAYKNGIQSIVPNFMPTTLFENPDLSNNAVSEKPLLLILLKDKAAILKESAREQEDPLTWDIAAFETFQTIDTLLVQTRQSCREDGSKYFLAKEAVPIYEQAVEHAFYLWENTKNKMFRDAVLAFCERNKAGVLLESLNDVQAKKQLNIDDHLIAEEQALQQAIAKQELLIFKTSREQKNIDALNDSLFYLKRKMEQLTRKIESESPNYFSQKFALAKPPTSNSIQNKLLDGQLMVEYYLGENNLYTIAISKNSFNIFKNDLSGDFYKNIYKFRQAVSDLDFVKKEAEKAEKNYLSSASYLFEILLKNPIAENKANINSIIIIPDGMLGYLPFEALLTEPAKKWKSKNTPYLIKEYAASYVYAAQFLIKKQNKNTGKIKYSFAGFGLEYDDRTLNSVNTPQAVPVDLRSAISPFEKEREDDILEFSNNPVPNQFQSGEFGMRGAPGKLPYSAKEVADISRLMNGRSWLNEKATKKNFLRHAPHAHIIHFAGHGFTDAEQPLNSSLLFSKTTDSTDCLLRAADLYGRPLNAQLAVLSACNTGYGELQKGEGIMSFARAFSYAGVPSLVMSLWSITDNTTAQIMKGFYTHLERGERKDEALQQAKLAYMQNTSPALSLPVFWAGPVVMGNAEPIDNDAMNWWPLLLIALLVTGAGFIYRNKKRRF